MITKICSFHPDSQGGSLVRIEVFSKRGLPSWSFVGLPGRSIKESRERLIASFLEQGLDPRPFKWVINFSPAFKSVDGSLFDLALAFSLFQQISGIALPFDLEKTLFLGELSLDGKVKVVPGILSAVSFAIKHGFKVVVIPEVDWVPNMSGVKIIKVSHLKDLIEGRWEEQNSSPWIPRRVTASELWEQSSTISNTKWYSLSQHPHYLDVLLLHIVCRFSVLLSGNPGVGKSHFANLVKDLLPPLSHLEWLELASQHEMLNDLKDWDDRQAPFFAPLPSISEAGLIGSGAPFRPGIVGLARHGALFIDEMLEYPKGFLEVLRQVLEEGEVEYYRARTQSKVNVDTRWIFATNLCPCGVSMGNSCNCSHQQIQRYRQRVSRAMLERINIHLCLNDLELFEDSRDSTAFKKFYERLLLLETRFKSGEFEQMNIHNLAQVRVGSESQRSVNIQEELVRGLSFIYGDQLGRDEILSKVRFLRKLYLDF